VPGRGRIVERLQRAPRSGQRGAASDARYPRNSLPSAGIQRPGRGHESRVAAMAELIVYVALSYLALGALFAIAFAARGAKAIDPAAAGAPWGFRLLIIPGAAALWPVMLRKWVAVRRQPPAERHP
jgi:hypothetical protein